MGISSGARLASLFLGLALAVSLTACGSSPGEGNSAGAHSRTAPTTIKHRFGTTQIEAVPKRVVTIGPQWTDVMLAMGVTPVGYTIDPLMPQSGVPWQELPDTAQGLSVEGGLPIEQIAALQPDLIVGTYAIANKNTYELLSKIAPTIPALHAQHVTPWHKLVRIAGDVLAAPETASSVINSVEREMAAVADELPGLEGKTFALAQYIVGDSMYIVADPDDGSSVFFQQLGMTMYPPVKLMGKKTGDTRISVSTERADLLRADLLVFLINGGDKSDLADIPGFGQLPGTVAILDYATIVALNTPSPLSIPYALDAMRPHLREAANSAVNNASNV